MTGLGAAVVAAAFLALGKPYLWGAAGPNAFDCSGLVVWSYQQIGMTMPRTSQQQAQGGQPVSRDQLQPGDLIIYYPDASHVGIYTGNGNVIHASTPGVPVAEVPIDAAGPYNQARRYLQEQPVTDTLFADVSEFQAPVDDSYPYQVLSIRSNDGSYQDHNFAQNYRWCVNAVNSGKLEFFICYYYWRPGQTGLRTHIAMVNAQGGPHPRMVSMIDLESGGNPDSDQSATVNDEYNQLVAWLGGNDARVIGYGNQGDLRTMWQFPGSEIDVILAGYGANPDSPNPQLIKLAHQYTDGVVGAGALPSGAPPFGNCDMNSADGLDPTAFAAACGITNTPTPPAPTPTPGGNPFMALNDQQQADLYNTVMAMAALVFDNNEQLRGPNQQGWPQLGQNAQGDDLTVVDAIASVKDTAEAIQTAVEGKPANG